MASEHAGFDTLLVDEHFTTWKARLYTPPRRSIPIHILSLVPGSAFFAGQYGDGLISVANPTDVVHQIISNFEDGARAEGKGHSQMPSFVLFNAAYTDDKDATVQVHKKYRASTVLRAIYLEKIHSPDMSAVNGAMVEDDKVRNRMCISIDPECHARYAQRLIDAGFDRLIVHSSGPDQLSFIWNYGQNVIPPLRGGGSLRKLQLGESPEMSVSEERVSWFNGKTPVWTFNFSGPLEAIVPPAGCKLWLFHSINRTVV